MRVKNQKQRNSWIIIFSCFAYFFVDENLTIRWERDSQSKLSVSPEQKNQIAELVDKIMKLKNEMQEHKQRALRTLEREHSPKILIKQM